MFLPVNVFGQKVFVVDDLKVYVLEIVHLG
jgi:hypothetical protein